MPSGALPCQSVSLNSAVAAAQAIAARLTSIGGEGAAVTPPEAALPGPGEEPRKRRKWDN